MNHSDTKDDKNDFIDMKYVSMEDDSCPMDGKSNTSSIDMATTAMSNLGKTNKLFKSKHSSAFLDTVVALYPVAFEFDQDERTREEVKSYFGYKKRANTPEILYIVQGFRKKSGDDVPKQIENDLAKVLQALGIDRVPPNASAIREWYTSPKDVNEDGILLTGRDKAFAIVKKASNGKSDAAAEARAKTRAEKDKENWRQYAGAKLAAPLCEVELTGDVPILEGDPPLQIAVREGDKLKLIDVPQADRARVQKLLLTLEAKRATTERPTPGRSEEDQWDEMIDRA